MNVESTRSELQRLLRRSPFRPFTITFVGGEQAIIEHSENVAFDPRPGFTSEFYVLSGPLRMFSTFESVSSLALFSGRTAVAGQADAAG